MRRPQSKRRDNEQSRQTRSGNVTRLILRRIYLLPDNQRKPRLEHVRHFVHGRHDDGALLVVVGADLVRPRAAQARQAPAGAGDVVAGPLPPVGDAPDCQRDIHEDVHRAAKDDGRPAPAVEEGVRRPGVGQRSDDLHCVRARRVDVYLRDGVPGIGRALEELRHDRHGAGIAVEEAYV